MSQPYQYRTMQLFPATYNTNGTFGVSLDYISYYTSATGSITASNVVPGYYKVLFNGPSTNTISYILVPTNNPATLQYSSLLVVATNITLPANQYAYPASVSDGRYAFATNGGTATNISGVVAGGALAGNYPSPALSTTQFTGGSGYSNVTYVSLSGNDSTGVIHDSTHPFLNVSNAAFAVSTLASSNNIEVVQVSPGLIPHCSHFGFPWVAVRGSGKAATTLWFEPRTNDANAYPMMSDMGGGWGGNTGGFYSLSDCSIIYSRGTNENIVLSGSQDPGNIGVVAGIGITNCLGIFVFTNASTTFYLDVGTISYTDCRTDASFNPQQSTNINTLAGGGFYNTFAFQLVNGTSFDVNFESCTDLGYNGILTSNIDVPDGNLPVYIGFSKLTNPSGGQGDFSAWLLYGAGTLHWHCKEIDPSATQNSLWWDQSAVPVSYFNTEQQSFFYCDWCRNYIYTSGPTTNQVNWFYLGSIGNENAGNGALVLDAGRNYVYAQKAYDKSGSGAVGIVSLGGLNTAYNWVNIEKVTRTQNESFVFGGSTNYESWVNILHYEDLVASPTQPGIVNTANSKLHIGGGYLKVNSGIGVQHQGPNSWLYLDGGLRIDTSAGGATSYALDVQSSNVYLGSVTMTNPASAPSIHSTSPLNVINSGGTWSSANSSGITMVDLIGDYKATNMNVAGASTLNAVTANSVVSSNTVSSQHFIGIGTAPAAVTNLPGSGAGSTIALDSGAHDSAMLVTLTSGSGPSAGPIPVATITFATAFTGTIPHSIVQCSGPSLGSGVSGKNFYCSNSLTTCTIWTPSTLAATTAYPLTVITVQ